MVRAWIEVLVRPGRFFRTGVAPGDQAPGLVFAVVIALVYTGGQVALSTLRPPAGFGGPVVSTVVLLAVVGLLVAPAVLHLTAAFTTVTLLLSVTRVGPTLASVRASPLWPPDWRVPRLDRAGVSETVQVVAYASAPGVFACVPLVSPRVAVADLAVSVPLAPIRVLAAGYGVVLFVYGVHSVHDISWPRSLAAGLPPAVALFGYGFGGLAGVRALLALVGLA